MNTPRLIPIWLWAIIAIIAIFITANACMAQQARPTYNPFNNNAMPFYSLNQPRPQYNYNQGFNVFPQQGYYNQQRPNYFPQNNYQRPNYQMPNYQTPNYQQPSYQQPNYQQPSYQQPNYQQPSYQQPNYTPQQNGQQLTRPSQPTNSVPLFTRTYTLNNGYLFGRPTLYYDPKSNRMQPWVRRNLR